MKKINTITIVIVFVVLGIASQVNAAERIWYENCETTDYTQHFLETQFGSNEATFWSEMVNEVSQSPISHTGTYSMVYSPIITGNPHTNVGDGPSTYGNTGNFDLSTHNNRYWYFRWYQRWEDSAYTGYVKIFYLGCFGDYYYIAKSGNTGSIIVIRDEREGNVIATHNGGFFPQGLDDEVWHKMEVYIDFGTGNADGSTWVKVDDTGVFSRNGLAFVGALNPVSCVMWPSNSSGSKSGSQRTWIDDQEIYVLTGANDIPPEIGVTCSDHNNNQTTCEAVNGCNYCNGICQSEACAVTIRADVNQDGSINSTDAFLTLRNSLGLNMSSTNWQVSATTGDVNCDGNTNSTDAMLILRSSLGLNMSGTDWCI
jgi:hypothetical protein